MAILAPTRRVFLSLFALFLFFAAKPGGAQPLSAEAKLEAVYLVKFVHFVEWPVTALGPEQTLVIGVLGADPFGGWLAAAAEGESVDHHPVTIRHIDSLKEAADCQVLFIASSERGQLRSILDGVKGRNVLTVSDMGGFCEEGGIVRFFTRNNKLRFRINMAAAHDANIFISSRLLQLAEIVNGPQNP